MKTSGAFGLEVRDLFLPKTCGYWCKSGTLVCGARGIGQYRYIHHFRKEKFMMKLSFTPEHPDYTNLKHMSVNLEFPSVNGDEDADELLEMFKKFLKLMNYSDEDINRLQFIYLNESIVMDDDDDILRRDDGFTEEEIAELNSLGVEVKDMDEVEEIVQENEEHRS